MRADPALQFWLDYVESGDGLWEPGPDSFLVMLPPHLQSDFGLPEEIRATNDPDVARDDGLTLLAAGHPALLKAAESVLDAGDVGHLVLGTPRSRPPDAAIVLEHARERIVIEHGRIFASGGLVATTRQVLRVGATVRYAVSADEHLQEQAECWVDVPTGAVLPAPLVSRLAAAARAAPRSEDEPSGHGALAEVGERAADRDLPQPGNGTVVVALSRAWQHLESVALARRTELAAQSRHSHDAERHRAEEYYAAAVASIEERKASANAERRALLEARVATTHEERRRRLADIAERYQPRHDVRPLRLHSVELPVLRQAVDIRRGERCYSAVLDWLLPAGDFAPVPCPRCGSQFRLVATKAQLGCVDCVPRVVLAPVEPPADRARSRPTAPPATPASEPTRDAPNAVGAVAASSGTAQQGGRAQPGRPVQPAGPARLAPRGRAAGQSASTPVRTSARAALPTAPDTRARQNTAVAFWQAAANHDERKLRRLVADGSPMAALFRMYGARAPLVAVGWGELIPDAVTANTPAGQLHGLWATIGELTVRKVGQSYLLRWASGPMRQVVEVLPFDNAFFLHDFAAARLRTTRPALFGGFPRCRVPLDPVAERLVATMAPQHGLTLLARSLASWWRVNAESRDAISGRYPGDALAAALHRATCYWSNADCSYADAARWYRVDEGLIRKVTPVLQRQLDLGRLQPW